MVMCKLSVNEVLMIEVHLNIYMIESISDFIG